MSCSLCLVTLALSCVFFYHPHSSLCPLISPGWNQGPVCIPVHGNGRLGPTVSTAQGISLFPRAAKASTQLSAEAKKKKNSPRADRKSYGSISLLRQTILITHPPCLCKGNTFYYSKAYSTAPSLYVLQQIQGKSLLCPAQRTEREQAVCQNVSFSFPKVLFI